MVKGVAAGGGCVVTAAATTKDALIMMNAVKFMAILVQNVSIIHGSVMNHINVARNRMIFTYFRSYVHLSFSLVNN